ncbi:hypothetical protein NKH18_06000 [Streptomyces sp. M10(2022)]
MSGEGSDLQVPPAALKAIAQGINLAHAELKDLGMIGRASTGRGFADLALSGLELGHGGLTSEFEMFCNRWEWGVRALSQKGNGFALAVGLSAGSFAEQEQYIKDSFKVGVNSLNGNPHLSEDEVKAMSWDTVSEQSPYDGADWSADSMVKANDEVGQTWRDTTYDAEDAMLDSWENSGFISPEERAATDAKLREAIDPSQGIIDQAEQPRWGQGS